MIRELKNVYIDVPDIPMSPLSTCFDKRLKPKKVKTSSIDIQTEPIEEPKPPLMQSQSISVQEDLKLTETVEEADGHEASLSGAEVAKKNYADGETQTDGFDVKNAYLDLNNQPWHYHEELISKLVDGPNGSDKQAFLNRLLSRIQLQDRDGAGQALHYQPGGTLVNSHAALYGPGAAQPHAASNNLLVNNNFHSTNTQSQNVYSQELIGLGPHQNSFSGRHPTILQSTLEPH
jgi:hypothetical protein